VAAFIFAHENCEFDVFRLELKCDYHPPKDSEDLGCLGNGGRDYIHQEQLLFLMYAE
jgi:hypothetical protein